ncbi:MAG: hypothetical protein JSY10_20615 [Paenibacillus sp.]|nr:hypothetical protein [Paenibacillus sp.]
MSISIIRSCKPEQFLVVGRAYISFSVGPYTFMIQSGKKVDAGLRL